VALRKVFSQIQEKGKYEYDKTLCMHGVGGHTERERKREGEGERTGRER
jgi:hypothetical protein